MLEYIGSRTVKAKMGDRDRTAMGILIEEFGASEGSDVPFYGKMHAPDVEMLVYSRWCCLYRRDWDEEVLY